MSNVDIRPVTLNDFETVYSFVCSLEEEELNLAQFRQCFDICLTIPHNHYYLAFVDENPVGYISCHGQLLLHHCGMVYEIQELYVDEMYRSKGIGALLIAAVEKKLAGTDYKLLEVASGSKRADAHRFYKANGFRHTSFKFLKEPE